MDIKRGDIICLKSSISLLYKTYYIVVKTENNKIFAKRCSLHNNSTFVYEFTEKEIVKIIRAAIAKTLYIAKQLEKVKELIDEERNFKLDLRKNIESNHLLNPQTKAVSLFSYDNGVKRDVFELISAVEAKNRISIIVGRKFLSDHGKLD